MRNGGGRPFSRSSRTAPIDPETLAAGVLAFVAADRDRLAAFLASTGHDPDSLRAAAGSPAFTRGLLAYMLADEPLLIGLAADLDLAPEAIAGVAHRVAGPG